MRSAQAADRKTPFNIALLVAVLLVPAVLGSSQTIFNDGDVRWFKSLPLWTRRGRSGFIKESLGTHGYFKATFDGKINPMDAVAVSLYKRVWPRPARAWNAEEDVGAVQSEDVDAPMLVE